MTKHYTLYKDGEEVGVFTAKQIASMLVISVETVYWAKQKEATIQKHYTVEEAPVDRDSAPKWIKDFVRDWDRERFRLNPSLAPQDRGSSPSANRRKLFIVIADNGCIYAVKAETKLESLCIVAKQHGYSMEEIASKELEKEIFQVFGPDSKEAQIN